jgi:acetyl esterase/lipase
VPFPVAFHVRGISQSGDSVSSEDILSKPQPAFDERVAYGSDANQFIEVRLPRNAGPVHSASIPPVLIHPALINIHGGYWRAKYDLAHAGHLCEALRVAGVATFNVEYRRVGNAGGAWPGTFDDIRSAYRFVLQQAARFRVDAARLAVMGHSAGGQLALCLAAHEASVRRVISLAGVLDLKKAYALHLSNDAVVEFMGGKPEAVPEHYREADPMELAIPQARQWILVGKDDDVVPPELSREYVRFKTSAVRKENAELVEIARAGHFDLIDPAAEAFKLVTSTVVAALA